jgi:acyl-coenzyme A thioesterase PaaI-like protein
VKGGRRFAYAEADVVDERDRLLARATATFAIMAEPDQ